MLVVRALACRPRARTAVPRRHNALLAGVERSIVAQPAGAVVPWCHKFLPSRELSVIGAAFSKGQPRSGTELGPTLLRKGNLLEQLRVLKWKVKDMGDVILPPSVPDEIGDVPTLHNANAVGAACELISQAVREAAVEKQFVLTLGGDHSIALGSIAGVNVAWPQGIRVLWVDSHADINTPTTSPSGNMHGMPLSFLMGLATPMPRSLGWLASSHLIRPQHLAYIGLRDVDPGEKRLLREHNIWAASMAEVDRLGIAEVARRALDYLDPTGEHPLHLSFDVDALDPVHAPSTGTAVPGGLSLREGRFICEEAWRTNRLVSMDLVEVNVVIGGEQQKTRTVESAILMSRFACGETYLDYSA